MLEAVQDFDLNDENLSSRKVQKLQLVKLLLIALTFGFSLTVTILVSEDKSFLSKLACSSYQPVFPVMSGSRFCENDAQFNLTSGLVAVACAANDASFLILRQTEYGEKTIIELSLTSKQWALLKVKVNEWNASF